MPGVVVRGGDDDGGRVTVVTVVTPAAVMGTPGVKVARWQNLIPSFPLDCARVEGVAHNPRKGRDQIL